MDIKAYIAAIDRLYMEQDAVYHSIAVRNGLSDSAQWILCIVSEYGESCTQQDILHWCHFPKQTVNSTVADFVRKGLMTLEKIPGTPNRKRILLTDEGRALAARTTDLLLEAERRAYSRFTDAERDAYLSLSARFNEAFREEADRIFSTSPEV